MTFLQPKVDGGATMEEMRQIRLEDRMYMEEQQAKQLQMMREFEIEREEAAALRSEAEQRREERALADMEAAENMAIDAARKIGKQDEEDEEFTPFALSVTQVRPE